MGVEPRPSLPDASQPQPAAGGGVSGLSAVYRELAIIVLILAILVAGVWTTVVGKSRQELEKSMLRNAQLHFQLGKLTQPEDENAFRSYLDVLQKFPDSKEAHTGIRRIVERYLEMIDRSLQWHDLSLARETLVSAEKLKPWIEGTPLNDNLAVSRWTLQKLEQDMFERRKAQPNTASRSFEPLEVFQDRLKDGNAGPNMIFIPGGRYLMGAPADELEADSDESPRIEVNVAPFAIGQTEVTFAQYGTFAAATGRIMPDDNGWGGADRPVINVTWIDARDYAQWLSRETGFVYRLPTEAEWEYAARAGTYTMFSTGDCLHFSQANIDDREFNIFAGCASTGKFRGETVPVTAFPPNPWGLYNVHDNVREWLLDCWLPSYEGKPTDGSPHYLVEGGNCGQAAARVLRGGVWIEGIRSARTANRYAQAEHRREPGFGFRLARDVHQPAF